MDYLMKCCMIETQHSQQTSAVSSGSCWEAGQSSHQPTTHRLMEELRECIAPLSRPSDVCWLRETCLKSSGVNCWLMLSLPSTLPLLRVLGRFPQNLPLGSCHAHHLMWWSKLVAMLGLETLSFTSRTCFREPRIPPRPHLDCWNPFQYLPGVLDPTLWTGSLGYPLVVPWGTTLCLLL